MYKHVLICHLQKGPYEDVDYIDDEFIIEEEDKDEITEEYIFDSEEEVIEQFKIEYHKLYLNVFKYGGEKYVQECLSGKFVVEYYLDKLLSTGTTMIWTIIQDLYRDGNEFYLFKYEKRSKVKTDNFVNRYTLCHTDNQGINVKKYYDLDAVEQELEVLYNAYRRHNEEPNLFCDGLLFIQVFVRLTENNEVYMNYYDYKNEFNMNKFTLETETIYF